MYREHRKRCFGLALRGLLILVTALALCACEANITGPDLPDWPIPPAGSNAYQSVEVSGTLTSTEGTCFEATVLWNGRELAGGRTECREPGGCARLDLKPASFERVNGHHTIAFQVVRQSQPAQDYQVEGLVLIEIENGMKFFRHLAAKRVTLAAGQSVTWELDLG